MVKISVIIPIYNVENYVEECLDSVLGQGMESVEIICVNDASTDNSLHIVERYVEKNMNIRVLNHSQNRGLSAARNTGLADAKGKYVLFVDSDDMILPGTLQELYEAAESKCVDIAYFNMKKIYESDMEPSKEPVVLYNSYEGIYSGQELFSKYIQNNEIKIEAWRQLIRRDFLLEKEIMFYEGILHEDNLFSFFCAMEADRVIDVNKEYYLYRQHKGSIMSSMTSKRMKSMYIVCLEVFEYWKNHNFQEEINVAIEIYFDKLYRAFSYLKEIFSEDGKLSIGGYAEKHLFALLSRPVKRYVTISDKNIRRIKEAQRVIVFGAGRAAMDVIQTCMNENITIDAIGVSKMEGNVHSLQGIEVHSMEDLVKYKEDSCVIVGVTKKFFNGVKEYLEELGFQNLIVVDE